MKYINFSNEQCKLKKGLVAKSIVAIVMLVSFTSGPISANELETEPKALQRLYKCFDKEITKLSKKKEKGTAESIYSKCNNRMNKWLSLMPVESHEVIRAQMTESVTLALEDAERGAFRADEG